MAGRDWGPRAGVWSGGGGGGFDVDFETMCVCAGHDSSKLLGPDASGVKLPGVCATLGNRSFPAMCLCTGPQNHVALRLCAGP